MLKNLLVRELVGLFFSYRREGDDVLIYVIFMSLEISLMRNGGRVWVWGLRLVLGWLVWFCINCDFGDVI